MAALIGLGIGTVVAIAATTNNFYLAITGILIGILFMFLVKKGVKEVIVDERIISISGQASRMTYVIVTMFSAILGLFLIVLFGPVWAPKNPYIAAQHIVSLEFEA